MEVWIFHGINAQFASGVFSSKDKAEKWILDNQVSGVLTWYPVDTSAYDWALSNGFFKIEKTEQERPSFIQKFSSGSQTHFHFENGELD